MKARELVRLLQDAGYRLDRISGSHHVFKHPTLPAVVVPVHASRDLSPGVLNKIMKDAGLK